MLGLGHKVTVVEENPHCIEATRERLERSGYSVRVALRGEPKALGPAHNFRYEQNYGDIAPMGDADCLLIEGDALDDPKLVLWLSGRKRFDAVLCWMIGTHQYRGHSTAVASRGITEMAQYRILVQNGVYDLAEIVLRPGGILSVADRGETPSTEYVRDGLIQGHREQASTTSLQVRGLRHKPYTVGSVKGGLRMFVTPPTDGSSPDRQMTQSLYVVTSVKP
ncbi:hypothetical protein [Burkholderia pseudomallei]|uniref:hypothetical protein n=1 Tax=Burkholderia pseudomallei TaxID=28450 RepID=UPI0030026B60